MKNFIAVLIVCIPLIGCVTTPHSGSDIRYVHQLPDPMTFTGFSIPRPEDETWYVRRFQVSPLQVLINKDLGSQEHTFFAQAALVNMPTENMTLDQLEKHFRDSNHDTTRNKNVTIETKQTTFKGNDAIRYHLFYDDYGAVSPAHAKLRTYLRGILIVHPYRPGLLVDAFYSERGPEEALEHEDIIHNGERFLNSIVLTKDGLD